MRWDQINSLEPGDILINNKNEVVEICSIFLGKANCIMYNTWKSILIDKSNLRKWHLYRAYSYRRKKEKII